MLKGTNLAGMSLTRARVSNDFYATPPEAVRAILNREKLAGSILEPAAGEGHISKILKEYCPDREIISTELIKREDRFGCNIKYGIDFLTYDYGRKFSNIITNPPFSLAEDFIEKAWSISTDKVIMFAKIQLLEGKERYEMFRNIPLKSVYVFSNRVNPMRNGSSVDENGKPWASTMCFAWFVWKHGYEGEPTIKWLKTK